MKRDSISKRRRFEIFKRDGFSCQYCGRTPPGVVLEIDHMIAVANGGGGDDENLVTSCFDCNRGKSDVPLTNMPAARKFDLAEKKEAVEQAAAYNAFLMDQRRDVDDAIERLGRHWCDSMCEKKDIGRYIFGVDRIASCRHFLKHMTEAELLDAIDIALVRVSWTFNNDVRAWRYFCGICWKTIKADR